MDGGTEPGTGPVSAEPHKEPPFGFQLILNVVVQPESQGSGIIPQIKAGVGERP